MPTSTEMGDKQLATRAFRVCQWALGRGGRFTARDLQAEFGLSEATSARYRAAWRKVFGDKPPTIRYIQRQRAHRTPPPQFSDPFHVEQKPVVSLADLLRGASR